MEAVALVVQIAALLTCAKSSKVLSSLRHLVREKLENYAASLESIFTLLSNGDIKVCLRVLGIEIRKLAEVFGLLGCFLFVVNTLFEEGSEASLCFLVLCSLLFLDSLMLSSQRSVCGVQLDSGHDVSHGQVVLVDLRAGHRPQIVGLFGVRVDLNCSCAVHDSVAPVFSVVGAH